MDGLAFFTIVKPTSTTLHYAKNKGTGKHEHFHGTTRLRVQTKSSNPPGRYRQFSIARWFLKSQLTALYTHRVTITLVGYCVFFVRYVQKAIRS